MLVDDEVFTITLKQLIKSIENRKNDMYTCALLLSDAERKATRPQAMLTNTDNTSLEVVSCTSNGVIQAIFMLLARLYFDEIFTSKAGKLMEKTEY